MKLQNIIFIMIVIVIILISITIYQERCILPCSGINVCLQ